MEDNSVITELLNMHLQPEVKAFFDEQSNTISYVVKDPASNACAIIDPVLNGS